MQAPSRRAFLKERTSVAHEALDKLIGPFDSPHSYRCYLKGMAAFRCIMEEALARADWPVVLLDWRSERLSPLISQDLADLDGGVSLGPGPVAGFSSLGKEELLGMLYVLEGSALGARLLYKRAQALGYDETFGARHLAAQSAHAGRWAAFLRLLEEANSIDIANVAKASTQSFKIAEAAFERARHG